MESRIDDLAGPQFPTRMFHRLRKFGRFVSIYGFGLAVFKAVGRLRTNLRFVSFKRPAPDIGIVGCGQYAFATIGYCLFRAFGRRLLACYDIDETTQRSLERAYGLSVRTRSSQELLAQEGLKTLFIASNHASHSAYAIAAVSRGLDVYIEKPISVSHEQLVALLRAVRASSSRVFAGYNRPFSSAVLTLRREIVIDPAGAFSMNCFVSGHKLAADHWYRRPEEGTRICGNLGHWLDLAIHVLSWRGLPNVLKISIAVADASDPDDNISISFTSDRGDLFSVMLTARCEPFEGINETINIQHGDTICKIDDFRRMTIWQGERLIRKRFWPKDAGHRLAILQPYQKEVTRDWQEVVLSTLLMLHITDMVRANVSVSSFSLLETHGRLVKEIEPEP